MEENPTPQGATPLESALRQIQAWFVNGDFEKVKQGCQEVLQIAPNNSIAQDLLQRAEEGLKTPSPTPAPTTEQPVKPLAEPEPISSTDSGMPNTSLPHMQEPILQEPPMPEILPQTPSDAMLEEEHDKPHPHSLTLNIIILVAIVVLGIGSVYAYNAFFKGGNETPAPAVEENAEENVENSEETSTEGAEEASVEELPDVGPDLTTWEGRNAKRSQDLSQIEAALMQYFDTFKKYPTAEEIGTALVEEKFLETLPTPPNDSEVYFYVVYGNRIGPEQTFILSAEFEQKTGEKTLWSSGESPSEHPDYRDVAKSHVTVLNPNMTELEYQEYLDTIGEEPAAEEEPSPSNTPPSSSGRVPRVPRN